MLCSLSISSFPRHSSPTFCLRNASASARVKSPKTSEKNASSEPVRRPRSTQQAKPTTSPEPAKQTDGVIPLLQRPLGIHDRPTTIVKTWTEKRNELMDQNVRLEQRKHLSVNPLCPIRVFSLIWTMFIRLNEASKGYFTDLNATRKHGGKTWIAPKVLIREDVCSRSFNSREGTIN